MPYRIVYYRSGREVGSSSHPGFLHDAQVLAKDYVRYFDAECYRIFDLRNAGSAVASGKRDDGAA
jgi:hypothetical protein